MSWHRASIDSIKSSAPYSLVGGPFGSNLTTRDYVDEGVPVIRDANLPDSQTFLDDEFVFVREEKGDTLVANTAYPGDLIFTQRGTLGQVGLIPKEARFRRYIISQSQMKLTVDETRADPWFVYYYFRYPDTVQTVKNHALTSGVPHINLGILKSLQMPLPPLRVQKSVVALLSAYDDLIENNRRRMGLLEEAARQLYREWFVRLRFPGHEHTRIIDGVPEGWEQRALGEVVSITMGNSPKGDTYNGTGEGLPLLNGPVEFGDRFTIRTKWTTKPTRVCGENDLIVCVRGSTTGRHVKSDGEYCLGRGVCAISGAHQSFVDELFKSSLPGLLILTGGATFPSWSGPTLGSFVVLWPPENLRVLFESYGEPISAQVRRLYEQDQRLAEARDLLLPRLMSGEIAV